MEPSKIIDNFVDNKSERPRYTLLMRPNKVEAAVQCFRTLHAVLPDFLVMVIPFVIRNSSI